jgi:hypothetical protein
MSKRNVLRWLTGALVSMVFAVSAVGATLDNIIAISKPGSPVADGGIDESGNAYSSTLLGTSIAWAGSTFTFGPVGSVDAVTSATISLSAGNYSTVNLLATGVNGDQINQAFVVTYTDGTTSTFRQSLSDWAFPQKFAGESQVLKTAYRIGPSGSVNDGTFYLYGYSFAINNAKTVRSITLPNNPNVVVLAVATAGAGAQASGAGNNVVGIAATGSAVPDGGLDGSGYAYSKALLGASITWGGSTFALGAADVNDAASSTTLAFPAGNYSAVNVLGTAVNGDQAGQVFVVTYTDGSTASFTQSLSDWHTPQGYAGETKVSVMPYRITASGAVQDQTFYLYGYSLPVNSAKTVKSVRLPDNRNVVVLALAGTTSGGTTSSAPSVAAAPTFSPSPGTYSAAQSVTISDSTQQAVIYYTTNGATPTTSSAQYTKGTPLQVSATETLKAIAIAAGYTSSAVTGGTYTISAATTPPTVKISGTPSTSAEVGQFYSFTPTVVASTGSVLTYTIQNKPSWAQFSSTTGTLSGTPTAAGTTSNIVESVSDGPVSAALPAYSIDVAAPVTSSTGTATLSWSQPVDNTNGTPLTNLAGYVVRYGTSTSALNTQISVTSASTTSLEISNLSPAVWYFEVAAVNAQNLMSQFSAPVSHTIQ